MNQRKVSIPKRVSEVLWRLGNHRYRWLDLVSIPKRVSEVLWLNSYAKSDFIANPFQSLKGFQRFCGYRQFV